MKIDTLSSNSYLYKVNRHRIDFQKSIDQARTLLLVCSFTAVVTFGVIMFIVRS